MALKGFDPKSFLFLHGFVIEIVMKNDFHEAKQVYLRPVLF
jgi:hypothetical protein